jgi:hypothetical protein
VRDELLRPIAEAVFSRWKTVAVVGLSGWLTDERLYVEFVKNAFLSNLILLKFGECSPLRHISVSQKDDLFKKCI